MQSKDRQRSVALNRPGWQNLVAAECASISAAARSAALSPATSGSGGAGHSWQNAAKQNQDDDGGTDPDDDGGGKLSLAGNGEACGHLTGRARRKAAGRRLRRPAVLICLQGSSRAN